MIVERKKKININITCLKKKVTKNEFQNTLFKIIEKNNWQ